MSLSVAYLCLQATREGQAAHAHVHEIVDGLRRRGIDVTLFEPEYSGAGLPGPLGRALEFRRVQQRLKEQARGVDAVYVRGHFAALSTHRWARERGLPVVQEVNGTYEDLFVAWPWTRRFESRFVGMMREQYRTAEVLIAVTDELAGWLAAETGRDDVVVIPNGANTDLFRPGLPALAGMPDRYVLFFGAFAPWQGLGTVVAAVRRPEWPEGVSAVFAGDGAERPMIQAAAEDDPRIVYAGLLPYADMPAAIGSAIAGLSPQCSLGRNEFGLSPLKLYETLACATPAVVTDFAGQADLVRDSDSGIVVPPDDPAALAAAVAYLAGHPEEARAMGARGREAIVAGHSWDLRAQATADAIERAVRERRR